RTAIPDGSEIWATTGPSSLRSKIPSPSSGATAYVAPPIRTSSARSAVPRLSTVTIETRTGRAGGALGEAEALGDGEGDGLADGLGEGDGDDALGLGLALGGAEGDAV